MFNLRKEEDGQDKTSLLDSRQEDEIENLTETKVRNSSEAEFPYVDQTPDATPSEIRSITPNIEVTIKSDCPSDEPENFVENAEIPLKPEKNSDEKSDLPEITDQEKTESSGKTD